MICPRCKKQIPNNTINCPHCNMKIGTICKKCNAYNLIYNKACIECGEELIKFCPNCNAANFPNVKECRKCGFSLNSNQKSYKKTKKNNTTMPKEIIIPPRQFVLPVIVPQSKLNKTPLEDREPVIIEKAFNSDQKLLPKKISKLKKKLINAKKKSLKAKSQTIEPQNEIKNTEKQDVQLQLIQLQEQLADLQGQLATKHLKPASNDDIPNVTDKEKEIFNATETTNAFNKAIKEATTTKKIADSEVSLNDSRLEQKKTNLKSKIKNIKNTFSAKQQILPNQRNVKTSPKSINFNRKFSGIPKKNLKIQSKSFNKKDFIQDLTSTELEYSPSLFTQQSAKNVLINLILNTPVKLISINGESGLGKNVVLKTAIDELKNNHIAWLIGKASFSTQHSPFGLIQDILLTFFNIPNFSVDTNKLKKDSFPFFKKEFQELSSENISELLNFLYPEKTAYFEQIYENKTKTFDMLLTIFKTITSRVQTVFVIDNFEYIDKMSYEFLKTLIMQKNELQDAKFVITYENATSIKNYFPNEFLTENDYTDIAIIPFNDKQTDTFIDDYNPIFAGTAQSVRNKIQEQTNGNPAYIEQILNLIIDTNRNYLAFDLPKNFNSTVRQRLEILRQENVQVYEILLTAAALGTKFYPVIINQCLNMNNKTFLDLFSNLLKLNYIAPTSDSAYEFKNNMLYKAILEFAKTDSKFIEINEKLFMILSSFTLSTHAILGRLAMNLGQIVSALNIYTEVTKLAAEIGDVELYINAQKESLNLVEKLQGSNNSLIKNNIYERLGKLLSLENPKEAIKYLIKIIKTLRKLDDPLKEFELTAYLADCCYKARNFYGVVECIDSAISNIDKDYELEIAMLKTRKLEALYKIGNYGEVVDSIDMDVMPVLEKHLDTNNPHKIISIDVIFEAWLKLYLLQANSLVLQGDNRCFNIIDTIFEIINKNEVTNELFICKAKITQAFAYTIKGETVESESILAEIALNYPNDILDNSSIVKMTLINLLNKFITLKFDGLQNELFEFTTYVNNLNDTFTKNISKLLLGKLLKENGKYKQALSIYTEQINYFAKEKNAIGVLFAWYLISELTLLTEGADKSLEYSLKALDIAQSPKIQNFYFISMLNRVIAEAYLMNSDFSSAKIYLESAMGIARQFELFDILVQLYWSYGQYLQELAIPRSTEQRDYILGAFKMYDKAINLAQKLKNISLSNKVMKTSTELRRFCQEKGITLK